MKRGTKIKRERWNRISAAFKIEKQEDWYKYTGKDVQKISSKYQCKSLYKQLKEVYPEFIWNPLLFRKSPQGTFKVKSNQRTLFDSIGESFGIKKQQDWNLVTSSHITKAGGAATLRYYGWSLSEALKNIYPELEWAHLSTPDTSYYKDKAVLRVYFDWLSNRLQVIPFIVLLAEHMKIKKQQSWYRVELNQLEKWGAKDVLAEYENSLHSALEHAYPEYDWNPLLFTESSHQQLLNRSNRRLFMDWIADQLGIHQFIDWGDVSPTDLKKHARMILEHYNGSLFKCLQDVYPEFTWTFETNSNCEEEQDLRTLLDDVADSIGLERQEEWYSTSLHRIIDASNNKLQQRYQFNSHQLFKDLQSAYPEFEWNPLLFTAHSRMSREDHRQFFDWTSEQLGIQKMDDWYSTLTSDVNRMGGSLIIKYYGGSLPSALRAVYPEFMWNLMKFHETDNGLWDATGSIALQRMFMDWIADDHGIESTDQWLRLPLRRRSGHGISTHYCSKYFLERIYPEFSWAQNAASSGQRQLMSILNELCDAEIIEEKRIFLPEVNQWIELDVYIPQLSLAFEFQGQHHYSQLYRGSYSEQQQRDAKKKLICDEMGITLIQVPYWCRLTRSAVLATIAKCKPSYNMLADGASL